MKKKFKKVHFSKELFLSDMEKRRGASETLLSIFDGHYDWADWLDGIDLTGKITGPLIKERDMEIYETHMFNPQNKEWAKIYLEKRWLVWEE